MLALFKRECRVNRKPTIIDLGLQALWTLSIIFIVEKGHGDISPSEIGFLAIHVHFKQ